MTELDEAFPIGNPKSGKCRLCGAFKEQQHSGGNKYLVCKTCDLRGSRLVVPE